MKKLCLIVLFSTLMLSGCVMQPHIIEPTQAVKDVSVSVINDTLGFEVALKKRLGRQRVSESSSNVLKLDVIEDVVAYSKYKQKIYIKDGKYQYKNCYVDTHHFSFTLDYMKDKATVSKDIIRIKTNDDSCDRYEFPDPKAYSVKKAVDEVVKLLNKIGE